MFKRINKLAAILILVSISLFAQVAEDPTVADPTVADTTVEDTTFAEEEGGREMYTSVDVSYSQDKGNTDFLSMYYGFDFTLNGDVGPLTDTEFYLGFNRSDDKFDGEPFSDDQYLTLKFDLWAQKKYSPFLFFQKSFDKTVGLEDRLNYGLGAKASGPFGLSISYAFLAESETYEEYSFMAYDSVVVDTNSAYWDISYLENGDSVYYAYDSLLTMQGGKEKFYRHSIRPKIKLKLFDESLMFDYRFFYKPKIDDFNDYLLEHELKISIATFMELLYIDLNYTNKYITRYADNDILNPETGEYYHATDEKISIGLSFGF
ncbi:MAG: hypothetical protein VYC00_03470 [Candidatus Neomarinimicrobiota bacterium]|nr:hypothetical protein [Candidatus Neomarinimicrobiota bacterium]